jgi:hypothetical protein
MKCEISSNGRNGKVYQKYHKCQVNTKRNDLRGYH